jgi:hypothetical protein
MNEAECYRELAGAFDDITMWRNLVALMPYTVHVDHEYQRAMERASRLLAQIPPPRHPIDVRAIRHRLTTPRGHL